MCVFPARAGVSSSLDQRPRERHGFTPNKGRNRDFEINEAMVRRPA